MTDRPRQPSDQDLSSDRQFARLVDAVTDYAIFMLDPHGYVRTWNSGAKRISGYTAEEIIGQHFSRFYTEPDLARDHPGRELEIATETGRFEEEGVRVRRDGSTFWAYVVISAVREDDGELIGFAKVTRDLSERRERELELRRAQEDLERSNADLEQFASSAAHDLAEPLRTVGGFVELILDRHREELPAEPRQYLDYIDSSVKRMQAMIQDLLSYARAGSTEIVSEPVDLRQAIDQVLAGLQALSSERGVDITVEIEDGACVMGDVPSVELVLQNLISNALKFADSESPRVGVNTRRDGELWRVEVTDNGIGIDPSHQLVIFEAFQRLHRGDVPGTGLGLSICQRIVKRLGGTIGVESQVGHGSRFWFTLRAG